LIKKKKNYSQVGSFKTEITRCIADIPIEGNDEFFTNSAESDGDERVPDVSA
jgi:hypothetical protein